MTISSLGRKNTKYLLLLPLLIFLLALAFFPTIYSYYISFNKVLFKSYLKPEFFGLGNYRKVLSNPAYYSALLFSIKFTFIVTVMEIILGLALAVLFNREFWGKRTATVLFLIPMMVSPALLGIMFRLTLNEFVGVVTYYLNALGIAVTPLSPKSVIYTLILIDVIEWTPFTFLLLYAALRSLPSEPLEAAIVDGASKPQIFRYICIPLIKPILITVILLRAIDAFKTFDMIYVLTGGGPGVMTTTISIHIYKMAFLTGDFGVANASSILLFYFLMIPLAFSLKYIGRR